MGEANTMEMDLANSEIEKPRWENMTESPNIEQDSSNYKLIIKYGGYFKVLTKSWKGTLVPTVDAYLKNISKGLGIYDVRRSSDNRAEIHGNGNRWEVILHEKTCTCWAWQVKGLPCVHAAAFVGFIRDANWDNYVDSYFTIDKYKIAYAMEIAPMPGKDQWIHVSNSYQIYPPVLKRSAGRPRKNRMKASDEPKKRHKCKRCGLYGHRQKTCKNAVPTESISTPETHGSTRKRGRGKKKAQPPLQYQAFRQNDI